jgi:aryl-alcohol dehydrogenase-like predicted oxidoreductase
VTAALGLGTHRVKGVAAAARRAAAPTGWVDTAPNYLRGHAHHLLAPVLAACPTLAVATKVGFVPGRLIPAAVAAGALPGQDAARGHSLTPSYLRWQAARNRTDLGRDRLDLLFVHNPEHGDARAAADEVLREAFVVLEDLVAAGRLAAYGVATWSGFSDGHLSVERLDRLASQAAGTDAHHLKAIQLPVSLITYELSEDEESEAWRGTGG